MTGIRTSLVGKLEKSLGVSDDGLQFMQIGDALGCTFTPNNSWQKFNSIGTKFRTGESAGKFSGSFTINTILDYSNIWILALAFEEYTYNATTKVHTFEKWDGKRPPSFECRQRILNRMVDGPTDVTRIYRGCVCKSMAFKQDTGASTLTVTITGAYQWQEDTFETLDATDWEGYDADKVEWSCLEIPTGDKIANVESLGFSVDNASELQYNTCSRKASNYFEKAVTFSTNATMYSNNPHIFMSRLYSGGYDDQMTEPKKKNLNPIPEMAIVSDTENGNYCKILMEKVIVEQMTMDAKANNKMVDAPTLTPRNFKIEIKNTTGSIENIFPTTV